VFIDETWAASQWHHGEGAAARPWRSWPTLSSVCPLAPRGDVCYAGARQSRPPGPGVRECRL